LQILIKLEKRLGSYQAKVKLQTENIINVKAKTNRVNNTAISLFHEFFNAQD